MTTPARRVERSRHQLGRLRVEVEVTVLRFWDANLEIPARPEWAGGISLGAIYRMQPDGSFRMEPA